MRLPGPLVFGTMDKHNRISAGNVGFIVPPGAVGQAESALATPGNGHAASHPVSVMGAVMISSPGLGLTVPTAMWMAAVPDVEATAQGTP